MSCHCGHIFIFVLLDHKIFLLKVIGLSRWATANFPHARSGYFLVKTLSVNGDVYLLTHCLEALVFQPSPVYDRVTSCSQVSETWAQLRVLMGQ